MCYMFRPVLRPSTGMSTQEYVEEDTLESVGLLRILLYPPVCFLVLTRLRMALLRTETCNIRV